MNYISIFSIYIFLLGLAVGSFLNVVIYRLYKGVGFFGGRSFCFKCKKNIKARDLIPCISFLRLKGKCRFCKNKISWQYPIVEFVTGILFVLTFIELFDPNHPFEIIFYLYITAMIIVVFVFDCKYMLILDKVIIPGILISLCANIFLLGGGTVIQNVIEFGVAGLGIGLFFLVQFVATQGKGIGGGDIRFGIFMGALLGIPHGIYALMLAYIIAAIYAMFVLVFGKAGLKSKVPLGPFLAFATFIFMLYEAYMYQLGMEFVHYIYSLI